MNNIIIKKTVICAAMLLVGSVALQAQATFGSNIEPVKAALLEIKDHNSTVPDSTNASRGGLVLPRVNLIDKKTLEPFIKITDTEWRSKVAISETSSKHIGLTVYNVAENNDFRKGIYIWTSTGWKPMKLTADYVFLPAFNLPWKENGSINLYDIYKKNFQISHPEYSLSNSDFHYVVTYYDNSLIAINSISNTGEMRYTINDAKDNPLPPENAYISVVMVKK